MTEDDRGLARERTAMAWTRTALSFAALGGVIAKSHVVIGLIVMAAGPAVWRLGRLGGAGTAAEIRKRARIITAATLVVTVVALIVSFLGNGTPLGGQQ